MEEKSVEIPKIQGPLREQDSIRALLELLEQQGMEQEKGDVIRMADHIDSMEMQLGTVLKELGEMKKQLGVMQESKVKLFAVNTIQKAEHQVQTLRFQVGEWKRKFVERAEQAVFDFKEKGKDALASAVKGMHLDQTGDLIRTAAELKPEVLFLALGLNDISGTDGDTDAFIEKYKAVLANVREQMPDAVLYINCVLPVSAQKEEEEPVYAKIPDYNTALKAMCDEEGITFIDNTEIVKDEYYEQDGEHMKAEYYPIWAEHMAEVAGI